MRSKEELLQALSDCVFEMEDEEVVEVAKEFVEAGYDPKEGLLEGLVDGMKRASALYEEGDYFVPELIVCSDAMYAGIEELQRNMPIDNADSIGSVVIGVAEGDTHDIGKNLVKIMLETGGFDVHDLGRDVPAQAFVDYARDNKVDIVGISALMTTTMPGMAAVIDGLKAEGIRDQVKVMIGGAPVSQAYADKIGADGYTKNAIEAVSFAKSLVGAE